MKRVLLPKIGLSVLIGFVMLGHPVLGATKPQKVFPEFAAHAANIQKAVLLADIVHFQDIKGELDKVEIEKAVDFKNVFFSSLEPLLKQKHYPIEKLSLTSMGIYLSAEQKVKLEKSETEAKTKNDELPEAAAPFFLDDVLAADEQIKSIYTALYKKLDEYDIKNEKGDTVIEEAVTLGELHQCDTLFVTTILARSVTTGALIAGGAIGGLIGEAVIGPNRGIFYNLYVIDAKTGKLLWADISKKTNYPQVPASLMKTVAKNLAKNLPVKI